MAIIKNPKGIWGILTGDIVRSSDIPGDDRERLQDFLYKGDFSSLGLFPQGVKVHGPQIFRGDSWQMAVNPAKYSLRIGIMLRATLKYQYGGTDTRVAIGIGQLMLLNEEFVSAGLGPAYSLSGKTLDQMVDSRMLLRTQKDHDVQTGTGKSIDLIVRFMDTLITEWTPAQAKTMIGMLQGLTQEQIAAEWKPARITQQAVSAHLKAANWKLVNESMLFIEGLIDDWENLEEAK
jgi:hypothetical protein